MQAAQPVRLLHFTDLHLFGDESCTVYDVNTAASFRKVLDEALGGGVAVPDAILVTGDIADDLSAGAYRHFRAALQDFGAPVLCLPGNHDDTALMAQVLDADGFQYCGRAELGGWGVVLLDTQLPNDPSGCLAAPELARLEADLSAFSNRPVLVCLHHPPVKVGSAWLDDVGLRNGLDVLAVIDRHPQVKVVLAGHVHQAFDRQRGGVRVLATPSTCAQFTPGTARCVMDLRPPGYRWLRLMPDGAVETEVMWLHDWAIAGRPRDSRA
jgi:3',5'-cyclic-AMP phosphodiesterase